jgi:NAD(P)-dependent dehydrogenase (short-subunit alcohol dehydrogenase family)
MSAEQKFAVITGASQGIGAALMSAFLGRKYRVIATSRSIAPSDDADVLAIIVDAILYLAGATFVTGEILHVDGGQSSGR